MEKKNTILLTVIAIATLLVAVVGATFAYFTATVTTTNDDQATTTVKTAVLASATMDLGGTVSGNADKLYPGAMIAKPVTITGTCPGDTATCDPIKAKITIEENIAAIFGDDISWKLYADSNITCSNTVKNTSGQAVSDAEANSTSTTNQFYMEPSCTGIDDSAVVLSSTDGTKFYNINVDQTFAAGKTYTLVVTYRNDTTKDQNAQQGKDFSITLGFEAQDITNTTTPSEDTNIND